jgi:hypothetical protein
MGKFKDSLIQDQAVASTFRHFGYRDGLAGNVYFPPETKEYESAYLDGYSIGLADRAYQSRISRMETETD